ncbi:MAG TPA: benzaldehyde lyase, partial [Alphaproteobacteria bacterium]|nr:benzaldehyde lyase [Alphaproteobacteria bacterium]
ESDLVLMVGARLDNQMNFGNPPLFPKTTDVVCINGSHEEIDFNRAADFTLLSDPGAFLQMLTAEAKAPDFRSDRIWYDLNRQR